MFSIASVSFHTSDYLTYRWPYELSNIKTNYEWWHKKMPNLHIQLPLTETAITWSKMWLWPQSKVQESCVWCLWKILAFWNGHNRTTTTSILRTAKKGCLRFLRIKVNFSLFHFKLWAQSLYPPDWRGRLLGFESYVVEGCGGVLLPQDVGQV